METKAGIQIKTGVRDEKRSRLWTNSGGSQHCSGKAGEEVREGHQEGELITDLEARTRVFIRCSVTC